MLILTRKVGESIRIGDTISVKVVGMDSRHVKIGIEAPRTVSVNREEIWQKIQEENQAAAVRHDTIGDIAALLKNTTNTPAKGPSALQRLFGKRDDDLPK